MINRLADKTAIVTEGAAGIGRACVIRMAEEGAKVAILDLLVVEGQALAAELTAKGHDAAFWCVDVSDKAAVKAAIDAAAARLGGLHAMVNNAEMSGSPRPADQVTEAEWDRVQAVLRDTAPDLEAAKASAGAAHPIGTMGVPDNIAWEVVWLASDEAKFVTGAEIVIDGDYTAR